MQETCLQEGSSKDNHVMMIASTEAADYLERKVSSECFI